MPLSKKANPEQNLSDQESGVLLDAAKTELAKNKDEGVDAAGELKLFRGDR